MQILAAAFVASLTTIQRSTFFVHNSTIIDNACKNSPGRRTTAVICALAFAFAAWVSLRQRAGFQREIDALKTLDENASK
jgi:hypothetical protein